MYLLKDLLIKTIELGASDLHLTVALPPTIRVNGKFSQIGSEKLLPDYIEKMIEVSFADPTAAAYVSDMYIISEKYKLGDDYSSCYRFMKADVPDTPEEIFHSLMKENLR